MVWSETDNAGRIWTEVTGEWETPWLQLFNSHMLCPDLPDPCVVCSARTLHQWYYMEFESPAMIWGIRMKGRGLQWQWCSTCYTFDRSNDGFVPEDWVPPYAVDPTLFKYHPGPIESARLAHS